MSEINLCVTVGGRSTCSRNTALGCCPMREIVLLTAPYYPRLFVLSFIQ